MRPFGNTLTRAQNPSKLGTRERRIKRCSVQSALPLVKITGSGIPNPSENAHGPQQSPRTHLATHPPPPRETRFARTGNTNGRRHKTTSHAQTKTGRATQTQTPEHPPPDAQETRFARTGEGDSLRSNRRQPKHSHRSTENEPSHSSSLRSHTHTVPPPPPEYRGSMSGVAPRFRARGEELATEGGAGCPPTPA